MVIPILLDWGIIYIQTVLSYAKCIVPDNLLVYLIGIDIMYTFSRMDEADYFTSVFPILVLIFRNKFLKQICYHVYSSLDIPLISFYVITIPKSQGHDRQTTHFLGNRHRNHQS